ncbi:MAG: tRNA (adenosine(37)-N6)-threonylcarbamoyltransferase complex ATPase subunit type 1 TsaE [Deltaproteobacteria bacterium]|nr:tRNA (adenosine(37)-N6)-threonylcarbamoyltransferase complex ATPase subunit type 1 TsaE [Nannocystaceae bacterium]
MSSAACDTREWRALDLDGVLALGERLGVHARGGEVLLLFGAMGAGKTTMVRALARGLAITRPDRVSSPTYNICVEHAGPHPLVHVDLCRLAELGDDDAVSASDAAFEALGLGELAERMARVDARELLVVEWAQLWPDPPADALHGRITRASDDPGLRSIVLTATGPRALAWLAALADEHR